jgi:membrane protease YdiL (CAAX protease family)
VEYHRVLAGEKRRIGRGILAIVLLVAGLFGAIFALNALGGWVDGLVRPAGETPTQPFTPIMFAAGLIATALLIPWSMLIQRWLYGVPAPSLHSVMSRFRWGIFGRAVVFIVPLFVIVIAITEYLEPRPTSTWSHGDLLGMLVVAVLLVPLQSAGEEYGLRGLVFRIAGGWARSRWISLLVGIVVSTAVFAVIHVAGDPRWNVFYVVFSVSCAFVTWRTGGLEIAVVCHGAYNLFVFVFWFVVAADLAERFDRSAGSVSWALFVPSCLAFVAVAVVVWLGTRRAGPAITPPDPGEAEGAEAQEQRQMEGGS